MESIWLTIYPKSAACCLRLAIDIYHNASITANLASLKPATSIYTSVHCPTVGHPVTGHVARGVTLASLHAGLRRHATAKTRSTPCIPDLEDNKLLHLLTGHPRRCQARTFGKRAHSCALELCFGSLIRQHFRRIMLTRADWPQSL